MTDTWVAKEEFELRIPYSLQILPMLAKERGGCRQRRPLTQRIWNSKCTFFDNEPTTHGYK